jgi:CheY-like chemotaxis protein
VDRPLDAVRLEPGGLQVRAGGAPHRAELLCLARAEWPTVEGARARHAPRRFAVRARLFASTTASAQIGNLVRVLVAPTDAVDLLIAVPGPSSVHLTAYGPAVGATDLALALAELVRSGALPPGLEIAELARVSVASGSPRLPGHPRLAACGDACAGHPLDPWAPALEQGQRAAAAVMECSQRLEELPERLSAMLEPSRGEVAHARTALARLQRAGALGPRALTRCARPTSNGLFLGLGPTPRVASRALVGASWLGPLSRLWRDQGPGLPPPPPERERPVYVVDDDPTQRALVCEYLAAKKLPVRAFADEMSLLAAAADEPPRAVVLDLVLTWVDGIRLCRSLKSHPATRHAPVVVVSGLARSADRRAALEAGAAAFLPKPLDLEALFRFLSERTRLATAGLATVA